MVKLQAIRNRKKAKRRRENVRSGLAPILEQSHENAAIPAGPDSLREDNISARAERYASVSVNLKFIKF